MRELWLIAGVVVVCAVATWFLYRRLIRRPAESGDDGTSTSTVVNEPRRWNDRVVTLIPNPDDESGPDEDEGIPASAVRPGSRLVDNADGDVLATARFPVIPGQVGHGSVSVTGPSLDDDNDDIARRRRESDDSGSNLLTAIVAAEIIAAATDPAPAQAATVDYGLTSIDTPSVGGDTGGGGDFGGGGASGDW